ncbi:MAG TPA: TIGR04282 family arsenosugar biosynthesis glycosyltransferase [Azospirillum sp.]|nr:TIGR04282 family arsenosugar biosynthesis glycosyltransferase [Azospirillum sp.]
MRTRHVIVFARLPRLGRGKRRLAAGVGDVAAWRFARLTLAVVLRRLARDGRWTLWLAVTPDRAVASRGWPAAKMRRIGQGRGDLGARMARPMRTLPPGPVVVVGSDIPDLDACHVARAFRALGRHDAVFGPAGDGGYWLVGLRRCPRVPAGLFRDVRWSTENALADTLAGLPPGTSVAFVDTLEDVDDAAAYKRWRKRAVFTHT